MGRYQLIVENTINNKFTPILEKASLYEIDKFTCGFENEKEFLKYISGNDDIEFKHLKVYIRYNYNGIKTLKPIYGDELIKKVATLYLENNEKNLVSMDEYRKFIAQFLNDVVNNKFSDILRNRNISYQLRNLLTEYVKLFKKTSYKLSEYEDLKQLKNQIDYLLNQYKVFRQLRFLYHNQKNNIGLSLQKENKYSEITKIHYYRDQFNLKNPDREEFLSEDEIEQMNIEDNIIYNSDEDVVHRRIK